MRILYVEDNPANLFLVQRIARMGNHQVVNYSEGQVALDNFSADKPDLVLMDIQLPGKLTGLDVVKVLRERGHKTPIIAVTAYAMMGDRERCLQVGCDAYIAKPLPVNELVEMIKHFEGRLTTSTIKTSPLPVVQAEAEAPVAAPAAESKPAEPAAATPAAPIAAPAIEAKPVEPTAVPAAESKPVEPAAVPVIESKPVEPAAAQAEIETRTPETKPADAEKPTSATLPPPSAVEAKPYSPSHEASTPMVATPIPTGSNAASELSSPRN